MMGNKANTWTLHYLNTFGFPVGSRGGNRLVKKDYSGKRFGEIRLLKEIVSP